MAPSAEPFQASTVDGYFQRRCDATFCTLRPNAPWPLLRALRPVGGPVLAGDNLEPLNRTTATLVADWTKS